MKKLLLMLLCLPMIFSCGEKDKIKKSEDRITELETANKAKYAPEHSVSTTIEIRDDNNTQIGAENLMEELELFSGENNLEDEIVILKSYSLAEKTITALGLDTSLTKEYSMKLEVSPLNNESAVLKLSIRGDRDAIRENIDYLNKLTEIYIRNGLDNKNLMANNTIHFIDEQLAVIQDSLISIENKIKDFRLQNPNLTIIDKDYGTYFQKQKLDNTLSEQSVNIQYYRSLLSYLKNDNNANSIVSPTSMGISNPELNNLINQLLQLYAKKGELQLTTTAKNPTYIAVLSQIDHTKETIIENVRNLIASVSIYEKDLKLRINTFTSDINKLPEAEKNYLILKRKHEYNEQTAIYLQQKRYEASLAKAGTESYHQVIDSARLDSDTTIK